MNKTWLLAALLAANSGCGMIGATRQVVIPPGKVDDYQSPAWIIHNQPEGAPLLDQDSES
jgi:hypothetical protein